MSGMAGGSMFGDMAIKSPKTGRRSSTLPASLPFDALKLASFVEQEFNKRVPKIDVLRRLERW